MKPRSKVARRAGKFRQFRKYEMIKKIIAAAILACTLGNPASAFSDEECLGVALLTTAFHQEYIGTGNKELRERIIISVRPFVSDELAVALIMIARSATGGNEAGNKAYAMCFRGEFYGL